MTDDAEIRQLNRQWRSLDKPTDVLSWPLEEIGEESPLNAADDFSDVLGDVVISLETASRQASARNWELSDEVALLLIHGVLHLLGHEDETEAGADAMKAIEEKLLGKPLEKV